MAPKKSIYRRDGAQHFQLVHRSQRDPLINDSDAGQRVLKPVGRPNDRKAYTLSELEESVDKERMRKNEGEAALYGITYDDSSYDYMSHLRTLNAPGGGEVMLLPAPKGSVVPKGIKPDRKGKGKAEDLFGLPEEMFASKDERTMREVYESAQNIPDELRGLQPDMDPHLRQVLEALDDDAFVDGEGEDVFGELLGGGEKADGEEMEEYEFEEWGVDEDGHGEGVYEDEEGEDDENVPQLEEAEAGAEDETWEDRFKAFKAAQKSGQVVPADQSEVDTAEQSEMADTIGSLSNMTDLMVIGGKRRRGKRGPSDATGMSMSSSSMFRNEGLRDLDERFDKLEKEYEIQDDDAEFPDDDNVSFAPSFMSSSSRMSLMSHASEVPEVSREDFDNILDDFLEKYEVVGSKYRPALGGTGLSGAEKLAVLRMAVEDEVDGLGKEENRRRIMEFERMGRGVKAPKEKRERVRDEGKDEEKWDVESILSTYTNTENHPGVIRTKTAAEKRRQMEKAARAAAPSPDPTPNPAAEDEDDSGSETEREEDYRTTVSRPKGETAEDRKARKAAVKAERSARRAEKKASTATFSTERKKQLDSHKKLVSNGRAADMAVGSRGVISLS